MRVLITIFLLFCLKVSFAQNYGIEQLEPPTKKLNFNFGAMLLGSYGLKYNLYAELIKIDKKQNQITLSLNSDTKNLGKSPEKINDFSFSHLAFEYNKDIQKKFKGQDLSINIGAFYNEILIKEISQRNLTDYKFQDIDNGSFFVPQDSVFRITKFNNYSYFSRGFFLYSGLKIKSKNKRTRTFGKSSIFSDKYYNMNFFVEGNILFSPNSNSIITSESGSKYQFIKKSEDFISSNLGFQIKFGFENGLFGLKFNYFNSRAYTLNRNSVFIIFYLKIL